MCGCNAGDLVLSGENLVVDNVRQNISLVSKNLNEMNLRTDTILTLSFVPI